MINYDNIPHELRVLSQWVCAFSDNKTPMKAWVRQAASSVNPDTWSDFSTARQAVRAQNYDYCGFVFNDNGIVGIDIDCGYDEYGLLSAVGADIIGQCRSYTEKSRSGRGFHILLKGDIPFKGRNNLKGVEIYKAARYFIMTGDVLLYRDITENQGAIDYLLKKYFSEMRQDNGKGNTAARIYSPEWNAPLVGGRVKLRPDYPPIPSGCRNISLTSVAGAMHNQGYNKAAIYSELKHVNAIACKPPLGDSELRTIADSITRYKR